MQVLNFYSTVFADQMKRGRKTATIRLGDKRHKYRKNQVVLVTVGYQYSPREKLFHAVIDNVEVKRVKDLSPRDIEHDNPEFRRTEELVHFLEQIYGREVSLDDTVTVVRFSQIVENPPDFQDRLRGVAAEVDPRALALEVDRDRLQVVGLAEVAAERVRDERAHRTRVRGDDGD